MLKGLFVQPDLRLAALFGLALTGVCLISALAGCPYSADSPAVSMPSDAEPPTDSALDAASSLRFRDVAASSGVDFVYRNGEEADHFSILESLGGGVALLDVEADGDLDLFLPRGGQFGPQQEILGRPHGLYQNLGDGRFEDVTDDPAVRRVRTTRSCR